MGHGLGRRPRRRRRPRSVGAYEEYHPYGTTSWWAEASTIQVSRKRYRYTGKEKDEETGLCYHGARYYMPWLGRWERPDPAGMVDGPNRFAYVRGNPVGASDPTGLATGSSDVEPRQLGPFPRCYPGDPETIPLEDPTPIASELSKGSPWADLPPEQGPQAYSPDSARFKSPPAPPEAAATKTGASSSSLPNLFHYLPADWTQGRSADAMLLMPGAGGTLARVSEPLAIALSIESHEDPRHDEKVFLVGSALMLEFSGVAAGVSSAPARGILSRTEAPESIAFAGRPQPFIADLSPYTGKGAVARNRAIDAIVAEDFPNLRLTHHPRYSPKATTGVAKQGRGTQIGKDMFSSRKDLRNTIIHEELHHRWWAKGRTAHHGIRVDGVYVPSATEKQFYETIRRYERMRGWRSE